MLARLLRLYPSMPPSAESLHRTRDGPGVHGRKSAALAEDPNPRISTAMGAPAEKPGQRVDWADESSEISGSQSAPIRTSPRMKFTGRFGRADGRNDDCQSGLQDHEPGDGNGILRVFLLGDASGAIKRRMNHATGLQATSECDPVQSTSPARYWQLPRTVSLWIFTVSVLFDPACPIGEHMPVLTLT
jgi:hypothetical protein